MKLSSLKLIAVAIFTCCSVAHAQDAGESYGCDVTAKVPFLIKVKKDQYQVILDQLLPARIKIDREAVIKDLSQQLTNAKIVPSKDRALEDIATELYKANVLPLLSPQVDKFNKTMNKDLSEDSFSLGFIAFGGLAKRMADYDFGFASIRVLGEYMGDDVNGQWNWIGDSINGVTEFRVHQAAKIDETIQFDLTPYGKATTFSRSFKCSGKVELEQTYNGRFKGPRTYKGSPETTVCFRPNAEVVATKEISEGKYFSLGGKSWSEARKTFQHAAILEVPVAAQRNDAE